MYSASMLAKELVAWSADEVLPISIGTVMVVAAITAGVNVIKGRNNARVA